MTLGQSFGGVLRVWQRAGFLPFRIAMPLLWGTFIWGLSAKQGKDAPFSFVISFSHNAGHGVLFGTLSGLLLLTRPDRVLVRSWWWTCAGLAIAYGVVDEVHQSWVPGRTCSVGDLVTDGLGVAAAIAAIAALASGQAQRWWVFAALAALAAVSALVETLR